MRSQYVNTSNENLKVNQTDINDTIGIGRIVYYLSNNTSFLDMNLYLI